jgi:hypothetical protein
VDILGHTHDDVIAEQNAVKRTMTGLADAIDRNKGAFGPGVIEQWNTLAQGCLAFASEDVGVNPFTLNDQFKRGAALLPQLEAWDASLRALGITPPSIPEHPPPAPAPGPPVIPYILPAERGSPAAGEYSNLILLLLLAFALSKS